MPVSLKDIIVSFSIKTLYAVFRDLSRQAFQPADAFMPSCKCKSPRPFSTPDTVPRLRYP